MKRRSQGGPSDAIECPKGQIGFFELCIAKLSCKMSEGGDSDQDQRARRRSEGDRCPTAGSSASARGFGLSMELVATTLVCAVVGWLIDQWLKIFPWGPILFLLLGVAMGVLNVMRAAGVFPHNHSNSSIEMSNKTPCRGRSRATP